MPYEFIDNFSALADYNADSDTNKSYDNFSFDLFWLTKSIAGEMTVYSECSTDSKQKTIAPQNVYITALKMIDGEATWNYIAGEDGICGWIPADVPLE